MLGGYIFQSKLMDATTKQWKEFHYGKKAPAKKHWQLVFDNRIIVQGNYALCRWKKEQMISSGEVKTQDKHLLKIV